MLNLKTCRCIWISRARVNVIKRTRYSNWRVSSTTYPGTRALSPRIGTNTHPTSPCATLSHESTTFQNYLARAATSQHVPRRLNTCRDVSTRAVTSQHVPWLINTWSNVMTLLLVTFFISLILYPMGYLFFCSLNLKCYLINIMSLAIIQSIWIIKFNHRTNISINAINDQSQTFLIIFQWSRISVLSLNLIEISNNYSLSAWMTSISFQWLESTRAKLMFITYVCRVYKLFLYSLFTQLFFCRIFSHWNHRVSLCY